MTRSLAPGGQVHCRALVSPQQPPGGDVGRPESHRPRISSQPRGCTGEAGGEGLQARTVGQELDLVPVETQVWHVAVAVSLHQVLESQRVPVGTASGTGCLPRPLRLECSRGRGCLLSARNLQTSRGCPRPRRLRPAPHPWGPRRPLTRSSPMWASTGTCPSPPPQPASVPRGSPGRPETLGTEGRAGRARVETRRGRACGASGRR